MGLLISYFNAEFSFLTLVLKICGWNFTVSKRLLKGTTVTIIVEEGNADGEENKRLWPTLQLDMGKKEVSGSEDHIRSSSILPCNGRQPRPRLSLVFQGWVSSAFLWTVQARQQFQDQTQIPESNWNQMLAKKCSAGKNLLLQPSTSSATVQAIPDSWASQTAQTLVNTWPVAEQESLIESQDESNNLLVDPMQQFCLRTLFKTRRLVK